MRFPYLKNFQNCAEARKLIFIDEQLFLTLKSRPTGKEHKCYYFAPDYNAKRFEESQGYIASNHFNAKVSSISFKGVFHLMSVKLGDHYIKLSTTLALNRIRKDEELEKGWRQGDIGVPSELRDLDLVHVVPLERVKTYDMKISRHKILF